VEAVRGGAHHKRPHARVPPRLPPNPAYTHTQLSAVRGLHAPQGRVRRRLLVHVPVFVSPPPGFELGGGGREGARLGNVLLSLVEEEELCGEVLQAVPALQLPRLLRGLAGYSRQAAPARTPRFPGGWRGERGKRVIRGAQPWRGPPASGGRGGGTDSSRSTERSQTEHILPGARAAVSGPGSAATGRRLARALRLKSLCVRCGVRGASLTGVQGPGSGRGAVRERPVAAARERNRLVAGVPVHRGDRGGVP
jgi:hypothetical protein